MYGHPSNPAGAATRQRGAGWPGGLLLPAGYSVVPALLWRRWRAQCTGWTGGLRNSRAAAVADAWRHWWQRTPGARAVADAWRRGQP